MPDTASNIAPTERDISSRPLELLAPAGNLECLEAALEAGADAVYFGLTALNARRRAKNFRPDDFARAVETVHTHGARAYLTLNIDLSERDVGQAARMLELARQSHVDAVLVRDPALLLLRPEYPEIEFHFSTQTCMANSADVAAAGKLGASRTVLAREMSLAEIQVATAVAGVQTEVFVQGALCFCVSGRCLLSSWIGGRSGNRGACTSPCRVPWTCDTPVSAAQVGETTSPEAVGTLLSMRDLAAIERLDALRDAGVAGLKIEGRLKSPAWVRRAVTLYRRALKGDDVSQLLPEVAALGAYTGRTLTSGYLDGQRDDLTGLSARPASPSSLLKKGTGSEPSSVNAVKYNGREVPVPLFQQAASVESEDRTTSELPGNADADAAEADTAEAGDEDDADTFDLEIMVIDRAIACRCRCSGRTFDWTMPKTVVRRAHKAMPIGELLDRFGDHPILGCELGQAATNDREFLMVRRAANAVIERVMSSIRQARKAPDDQVRIDLPESVRQLLEKGEASSANSRTLGEQADRLRIEAASVAKVLRHIRPDGVIVEGLSANGLDKTLTACNGVPLIAALPSVFFEEDIPAVQQLVAKCVQARVAVEVNTWGGWQLARKAGARMESGPGLPVLNSLAARQLAALGMRSVTLSPEADHKQLEELTAHCAAACSLVVFGRPALLTSRAQLPKEYLGRVLADRRSARLVPRREGKMWVFRPVEPFDLRTCKNERIRVRHLVVDLVASPDPVGEWFDQPATKAECFLFNYNRTLA